MRARWSFEVLRAGAVLAPALAGVWLLSVQEEVPTSAAPAAPARTSEVAQAGPGRARAEAVVIPAPSSPAADLVEEASASCAAAPIATDTLAALPSSLDALVVDAMEAESRARLGRQLIEWLAIEDHPAGALMEAEQIGELMPWLAPEDVARLLNMARSDALEARRRAAFVALGQVRPITPAHLEALMSAFSGRPSEDARLGLLEALLALRRGGASVADQLELALDHRFGAPSPEAQAFVATSDPRSVR